MPDTRVAMSDAGQSRSRYSGVPAEHDRWRRTRAVAPLMSDGRSNACPARLTLSDGKCIMGVGIGE